MDEVAVSIIIPIYNAGGFLEKGLNSCVNQTLQNIEILCVNDASTDNSSEIIRKYAERYPGKVIPINLEKNSGPGEARNQGILRAKGKYLCFMDSDDYLDIRLCSDAYEKAEEQGADMVFYDFMRVEGRTQYYVELIGQEETKLWYQQIGCAPWLQILKREVIVEKGLFMPQYFYAEDDAVVPLWRYYAGKKCKIQGAYYYYVHRADSIVNGQNAESMMLPVTGAIPYRYHEMERRGLLRRYQAESDWMMVRDILFTLKSLRKQKQYLNMDSLMHMWKQLRFLDGYQLEERYIKYNLSCAERDMVKTFLHSPQLFLDRYGEPDFYEQMQVKQGLDVTLEPDIRKAIKCLWQENGKKMAVWGAGEKGIPIIATLLRMGYDFEVFDNRRYGSPIWNSSGKYICPPEELSIKKVDVVLVTSDYYFKQIEEQIHESNPQIAVVNFMRMLRIQAC